MNLQEIKTELKGYFIYKNGREYTLAKRDNENFTLLINDIEYKALTDKFVISPTHYLLMQINNQLLDPTTYVTELSEVIPVIDFHIFELYDKRNLEIETYKHILDKIKGSKSIFGRKKDFKLICIKSKHHQDNENNNYYVIKDNQAVPIDATLIENVEDAVIINNLQDLRNALKDNLVNQYIEKFNQELSKWESLN